MNVESLLPVMTKAAQSAFGNVWARTKNFAVPELEKIARQVIAIEKHKADYTEEGARILMRMQITASQAVIVGMTELTLQQVEASINAVLL